MIIVQLEVQTQAKMSREKHRNQISRNIVLTQSYSIYNLESVNTQNEFALYKSNIRSDFAIKMKTAYATAGFYEFL